MSANPSLTSSAPNRPRPLKGDAIFVILTRGTYRTFTRAIKEAVSNSYDADANHVQIDFAPKQFLDVADPAKLTIQIRDDGKGMSLRDFWDRFASIESEKTSDKRDASSKRYPIGQFGIGSFALVPFSREVVIYSKKYKEKPIKCVLDCPKLLAKTGHDYADHVANNIVANEIDEDEWETVFGCDDSGTVIVIEGVTPETFKELVDGTGAIKPDEEKHLFPNAPFTIGLKEIAWELSTLLPLEYAADEGDVADDHGEYLESNNPGIGITLSEEPLERKIYSKPHSTISRIEFKDKKTGVHVRGVIVALPKGAVQPRRANGVLLRLNNVGIGEYRTFSLVGNATIRGRITGEIHVLGGLHGKLNAARDNFTGPAYDGLREYLDKELVKLHNKAYANWKKGQQKKSEARKKKTEQNIKKVHTEVRKAAAAEQKTVPQPSHTPAQPTPTPHAAWKETRAAAPPANLNLPPKPMSGGTSIPSPAVVSLPSQNGFHDPVCDIQGSKGKVRFDESHELFQKFHKQAERETIELVLSALKLARLPDDAYQRFIRHLIALK